MNLLKTAIFLVGTCFFLPFSVANENELTGTYSGNELSLAFLKGLKVDVTMPVPQVVEIRRSQIKQQSATSVTIRCTYQIFAPADLEKLRKIAVESGNIGMKNALDKYTQASGYPRWIGIESPPGAQVPVFLAESEGSLVDVINSRVYKKHWLSR